MVEDYDLSECLQYNPLAELTIDTIDRILAVIEGENDGKPWRWIVALTDGRFGWIVGACDYTGWSCQSSAVGGITDTVTSAMDAIANAWLIDETYDKTPLEDMNDLADQITGTKRETWRERMDKEFGVNSVQRK